MFYYLCKIVITSTSVLYPLYASYKALRPAASSGLTPQEQAERLERWLMYWCVVACVWTWEHWAEWSVSWFPFYHEVKTLVMLWLVLPQIQGSTYIYIHHLSPFLTSHEDDIDAALADARTSATRAGLGYANAAVRRLRALVLGSILGPDADATATAAAGARPRDNGGAAHAPPVLAEPGTAVPSSASGAGAAQLAHLAGGLLRTYAPAALAAGNALLHPMGAAGATTARAQQEGARRRGGAGAGGSDDSERDDSDASTESASGTAAGTRMSASSSFEEIGRDEASGFPPAAGAGAAAGTRKAGGWFGWGAAGEEAAVGAEKKNA
ncbi:uncharacterized protein RHOBADRAFT_52798 [Rhodotorula graminis WP1]|uniref:Protein YOP1 n=1 Tax=Rhodotorula graminis (strain WP1) TaxID=578459 RepID=A0A194S5I7_RHOGW|nr:uncharacterized protein RHOBADRAFT_52798 [Rhodotorula graminis WP1]KPV75770.1 hypothetical protein RHOBADRAFT_52798 [Rhodotorula graminis WP1]